MNQTDVFTEFKSVNWMRARNFWQQSKIVEGAALAMLEYFVKIQLLVCRLSMHYLNV